MGRFLSADTIVPNAATLTVWPSDSLAGASWVQRSVTGNPQDLNRYTYALNNPLKYTDPDGHWPRKGQGICACAGFGPILRDFARNIARAVRQHGSSVAERTRKIFAGAGANVAIEVSTAALDPRTRNPEDLTIAVGRGLASSVGGNAGRQVANHIAAEVAGSIMANAAYDVAVDGQSTLNSVRGDLGGALVDTFFDSSAKDVQYGLEMAPAVELDVYQHRHAGLKGTGYALQVMVGAMIPQE